MEFIGANFKALFDKFKSFLSEFVESFVHFESKV